MDGDVVASLTVRPWFDTVGDLQAQAFATDTPWQRQRLLLRGKPLQDNGRVLARHGVVAECTIQLVSPCNSFISWPISMGSSTVECMELFVVL